MCSAIFYLQTTKVKSEICSVLEGPQAAVALRPIAVPNFESSPTRRTGGLVSVRTLC